MNPKESPTPHLAGGTEVMTPLPAITSRAHARPRAWESALELLEGSRSTRPRRPRAGLFRAHWLDLSTGRKWKATRTELVEAYHLLARHRDLWEPER
jgi:hypothetical protein